MVTSETIFQLARPVLTAGGPRTLEALLSPKLIIDIGRGAILAPELNVFFVLLYDIILYFSNNLISIILVMITTYYAHQLRRSAEYTQENLEEMEKDRQKEGILLAISHVLDPLVEEVESKQEAWEHTEGPPKIDGWEMPDRTFVTQLKEADVGTHDQIQNVIDKIEIYRLERHHVRGKISRMLASELVWPDPPENESRKEEQRLRINDKINRLANYAINPREINDPRNGDIIFEFENLDIESEDLSEEIRRMSGISDSIEELARSVEELQTDTDLLLEYLFTSRKQLKQKYGIAEVEILNSKENIRMTEPRLTKDSRYR